MTTLRMGFDSGRRTFVKGIGLISSGVIAGALLGGCETLIEQIKNRPIRRRIRGGSSEVDADIATYRQAVTLMKSLPSSDPRSWQAQAAIHGSVNGGFNLCQHGTSHFFSWHRAYLSYFEQICRKLTGDDRFGLPYWNWNQDQAIHAAFLAPGDALFHPRASTSMAGVSAVSAAELDPAFADNNFFTFSNTIESTPHNTVHVQVGLDMVTGGSPLDPIFWPHHCMVDYCWAKWNIELGNDNTNDSNWVNTEWDYFVDANGNPVPMTAGLTTIMPLLSYQYETSAIGSTAASLIVQSTEDFSKLRQRIEKGVSVKLEVQKRYLLAEAADMVVGKPFTTLQRVRTSELSALVSNDKAAEKFFVQIAYADYPKINDFFVRVFINLPTAAAATPVSDPHYAGSFAIFGTAVQGQLPHHSPSYLVNVTDAVRGLAERGELSMSDELSVQLVAVPAHEKLATPDAVLKLQRVELLITPVVIKK